MNGSHTSPHNTLANVNVDECIFSTYDSVSIIIILKFVNDV